MVGYTGATQANPPSGESAIVDFGYIPSLAMGIIGILLFAAVMIPHLWWFVKKRGTRSVHGLMFFACVAEMLGYGARLYAHGHPWTGMSFLLGIALVQISTILVTAALYKSIQRGTKYFPHGDRLSPMRPRSLVTLFVILDVVWVLLQIAGQYFVAGAESSKVVGDDPMFGTGTSGMLFLGGNVLQAITIIIVSIFVWVIYRRAARALTHADETVQYPLIQPLLVQVLASFGLFFVRLIVRIAQGAQGIYGYAGTHEWVFGVFEFAPIFLLIALWAARPLFKFLFPLGHHHGEGAHVRADVPVSHLAGTSDATGTEAETKV